MDLHNITGWSISILVMTVLVILLRIRSRKRNNRKLAVLHLFANENNCVISTYDTWENTLVGISNPESNRLFFIRSIPDREIRQVINLSEVTDCRMVKTGRTVKYNNEPIHIIDKIELIFSFGHLQPAVSLEFYNADYNNLTLSGELQLAQKWTEMVISGISVNKKIKIIPLQKARSKTNRDTPNISFNRKTG